MVRTRMAAERQAAEQAVAGGSRRAPAAGGGLGSAPAAGGGWGSAPGGGFGSAPAAGGGWGSAPGGGSGSAPAAGGGWGSAPGGGSGSALATVAGLGSGAGAVQPLTPAEQKARVCLRRFRRETGSADIDPLNRDHLAAYLLCKQVTSRPTPAMVLQTIRHRYAKDTRGVGVQTDIWLVPKVNFPDGVPEWLQADGLLDQEDVKKHFTIDCDELDFSAFWVVDGGIPRHWLGLWVKRAFMYAKSAQEMLAVTPEPAEPAEAEYLEVADGDEPPATRRRLTRNVSAASAESGGRGAQGGGSGARGSGAAAAPQGSGPRALAIQGGVPGPRALAPQGSNPRVPAPQARNACRAAVLAEVAEEATDDPEAEEMLALMENVKKAAKSGSWHSKSAGVSGTVSFWCRQLLNSLDSEGAPQPAAAEALQAAAGAPEAAAAGAPREAAEAPQSKQALLKQGFLPFLARLLVKNSCYNDLGALVEVFDGLVSKGCAKAEYQEAFRALARHDILDGGVVVVKGMSLSKVMSFFDSPLYRDFEQKRLEALLDAAMSAPNLDLRQKRLTALTEAAKSEFLKANAATVAKVTMATSMFSPEVPALERVRYALEDEKARSERLQFATSWRCDGGQGGSSAPGGSGAQLGHVPWAAVRSFAEQTSAPPRVSFQEWLLAGTLVSQTGVWRKEFPTPLPARPGISPRRYAPQPRTASAAPWWRGSPRLRSQSGSKRSTGRLRGSRKWLRSSPTATSGLSC